MPLELRGVTKDFGAFRLAPLTLMIRPGGFFSLLGPSGCGKTTVLRLIGGLETVTAGAISLQGKDITHLPSHQRNIHTVFQRYALFPHLNVFENVAFPLRLRRTPKLECEARVTEMLKLVEIVELKDRRTHQLSGGECQRVALARALVDHPEVLLLDEPLSALDPSLRMRMREELKALCRKVGSTFLLVTHDQEEALQLSDRIAVMRDGVCLQVGTPKEIYEEPVDPFVARFIGPVNEVTGEITEETTENIVVSSTIGSFKVRKNGVAPGCTITMVLRPEKTRLLRQRSSQQENLVEGSIQEICYLGSRTEYTVKVQDTAFKVFEQELERIRKRSLNQGDRVYLTWNPEDAIILGRGGPLIP